MSRSKAACRINLTGDPPRPLDEIDADLQAGGGRDHAVAAGGDEGNAASNVQRRRLKYAATINDDALGEETESDYELKYLDIGNVDSSGTVHKGATYRFADAPTRSRRRVRRGDVIISCVRNHLQAIAPIQDPPDNLIVSTGFTVVRSRVGVCDAEF
ncbi:MAG: hypothetical protein ACREXS_04780 [Gammaproteobacteria bacterium]